MESKSSPLVSVYIPTHNRAELVCKAVDSVLAQTYVNVEVVVCVDGSSDDTIERLTQKAESDTRLKIVVNEKPMGANVARNAAIAAASGRFITGLDDDDHYASMRIEAFVSTWMLLEAAGEMPAFLFAQDTYNNGSNTLRTRKPSQPSIDDLCMRNAIGNQIFAEKSKILQAGAYDVLMPAWQDLDLWLRMTHCFGPGHLVDLATLVFNDDDRPDRITKGNKAKIHRAWERIVELKPYLTKAQRQNLFLQYIGPYYALQLSIGDLWAAFQCNPSLKGGLKILRVLKDRGWKLTIQ